MYVIHMPTFTSVLVLSDCASTKKLHFGSSVLIKSLRQKKKQHRRGRMSHMEGGNVNK